MTEAESIALVDEMAKKYGERHRNTIEHALTFLKERQPIWGVEVDPREYIESVVSRVST